MRDDVLEKEIAFLREVERCARVRGEWLQYFEFCEMRESKERRLAASLRQPIS